MLPAQHTLGHAHLNHAPGPGQPGFLAASLQAKCIGLGEVHAQYSCTLQRSYPDASNHT